MCEMDRAICSMKLIMTDLLSKRNFNKLGYDYSFRLCKKLRFFVTWSTAVASGMDLLNTSCIAMAKSTSKIAQCTTPTQC